MSAADDFKARQQQLLELTRSEIGSARASLGDSDELVKETLPIGIPVVDNILGGGLRKGRVALIVGHESMGKTLLVQWIIRAFQEKGELCGYIDAELTYEPAWFGQTGVDVSKLIVAQPTTTEQAFDLATMWASNDVGLIVIDSLAALTPKAQLEADLDDQEFMALGARKLSLGFNKFVGENLNSVLVCTNQLRQKIGIAYGNPDEIPGGRAQRFYASYILKVRRKEWIKDGDTKVGYNMAVTTDKNKLNTPMQEAIIPFMFTGAIDTLTGLISMAIDLNVLQGKRGFFTWKDTKIHGKNNLKTFFAENPVELDELQQRVAEVA